MDEDVNSPRTTPTGPQPSRRTFCEVCIAHGRVRGPAWLPARLLLPAPDADWTSRWSPARGCRRTAQYVEYRASVDLLAAATAQRLQCVLPAPGCNVMWTRDGVFRCRVTVPSQARVTWCPVR